MKQVLDTKTEGKVQNNQMSSFLNLKFLLQDGCNVHAVKYFDINGSSMSSFDTESNDTICRYQTIYLQFT